MKTKKSGISIAVIGLGNMGAVLANTFLQNGYPLTVWNRSSGKADRLISQGAVQAPSVTEAVRESQLIVACVSTYEVMHGLLDPVGNELEDRILVNLTTGTPSEARRTAEWAKEHGILYLNGAIMATPSMIGSQETLIFYGGEKGLYKRLQPVLAVLGENAVYIGEDSGAPLVYDMALLTMLYGAWYSWMHAQALLRTANISAATFLPYATSWLHHVIAPVLTDLEEAEALDARVYDTEESNLNVNKLALDNIVRSSTELGIPVDWLIPIQQLANQKVEEGYGNDAFTRLFDAIESRKKINGR